MALDRLLEGKSSEAVYQELWPAAPSGQRAMGYLFDIRGRYFFDTFAPTRIFDFSLKDG